MTKSLVEQIQLDNGLVLNLYNASKKIAMDRWQVVCIAGVEVPVDYSDAEALSSAGIHRDDLRDALGDPVVFEKHIEKNFVDDKEADQVRRDFFESMTESLIPYLSRPDFPVRFLIRRYREFQKQSSWRKTAG
ncbi:hypothetical protein [Desulfococcus sp.]|uniref:hypothetical protein n=1 Tax=Desulfococcus sp. TaxID=2025834 RepID=UPI0035944651